MEYFLNLTRWLGVKHTLNLSMINNLLKILVILSGIVSSNVASKDHEHSGMAMIEDKHHFHLHPSSPMGVTGNMHHEGFMFSIKHGLMSMNHNISNGNNICLLYTSPSPRD